MIMYFVFIENENITGCGQAQCVTENIINVNVTEEIYNDVIIDRQVNNGQSVKYIYSNGEIIVNPEYEEEKARRERQKLDALTLTPADVERALYKAKQMDFDDLKALIVQALPTVDIKALSIEFRAKDFYRGATANGMRLFDVVGQLLGYNAADMDYLFLNKELPE